MPAAAKKRPAKKPEPAAGFSKETFRFLRDLAANNDREWFADNRERYETHWLGAAKAFIRAVDPQLRRISPCFVASDKTVGGSLMRIYRDTRFSKNKTPFKTNVGIHFKHEFGCDVHAPGFYTHIAPGDCFVGAGIWMPSGEPLKKIRAAIDADPKSWLKARDGKAFADEFDLAGESLKVAPAGTPKDHPLIEDLRRKSFIGVSPLTETDVAGGRLDEIVVAKFRAARGLVKWLCGALDLPY
ncbi:MAG: DUF2461 domain-containing protein [Planctomycetota bacterium]